MLGLVPSIYVAASLHSTAVDGRDKPPCRYRYCSCGSPSVFFLASSISVMATSISARVFRSGASSSACFSAGAVRRHHRQRVDQRLVRRLVDAVPVGLEIVGLEEVAQRREQRLAVDRVLALARDEVVGERRKGDAALPVGGLDRQFVLDCGSARRRSARADSGRRRSRRAG